MAMDGFSHLSFQRRWELSEETVFQLGQCEAIIAAISGLPLRPDHHRKLLEVSLVKGAQATTAIEGNTLTSEEIEKVARGGSLPPSKEYQEIEVRNVLDAMNQILREVIVEDKESEITPELLRSMHRTVGAGLGSHFDAIPGAFRTDPRVVGRYECPDHRDVPDLVARLCAWLRAEFGYRNNGQRFMDAVIEAIVAHVYIEWIHPFGDGNGRAGRLVELYILLRAGNPDIASHILSNLYNLTRPQYYRELDRAGETGDLTVFIAYAVLGFRDGLQETLRTMQRSAFETAWRRYIYDEFADRKYRKNVFKRRRELIIAMPEGEALTVEQVMLLTPEIARLFADLSVRTVSRDLKFLEEMGLVRSVGKRFIANSDQLRHQMPARKVPREIRESLAEAEEAPALSLPEILGHRS